MQENLNETRKVKKSSQYAVISIVSILLLLGVMATIQGNRANIRRMFYFAQVGHVNGYFHGLSGEGADVTWPNILEFSLDLFENPQELVWTIKSKSGVTDYIWELYAIPENLKYDIDSNKLPVETWWSYWCQKESVQALYAILIPANEPALEVHKELGLPLPPDFSLDKVNENYDPFAGETEE